MPIIYRSRHATRRRFATIQLRLALRPRSVAVLNNLGIALKNQGKLDEAIACFRKAIELDPKFARPTQPRHRPVRSGEAGRGHRLLPPGHRTRPDTYSRHRAHAFNLGPAPVRDQGKLDEAIACYRKAIELDPKLRAGPQQPRQCACTGSGEAGRGHRLLP